MGRPAAKIGQYLAKYAHEFLRTQIENEVRTIIANELHEIRRIVDGEFIAKHGIEIYDSLLDVYRGLAQAIEQFDLDNIDEARTLVINAFERMHHVGSVLGMRSARPVFIRRKT